MQGAIRYLGYADETSPEPVETLTIEAGQFGVFPPEKWHCIEARVDALPGAGIQMAAPDRGRGGLFGPQRRAAGVNVMGGNNDSLHDCASLYRLKRDVQK